VVVEVMTRPVSPPPTPEETALKVVFTLGSPGKRSKWLIHMIALLVVFSFGLEVVAIAVKFSIPRIGNYEVPYKQ
jgi:hypothetical protein